MIERHPKLAIGLVVLLVLAGMLVDSASAPPYVMTPAPTVRIQR